MARSNGDLVAKARALTEDVGRRPATVDEARALLGVGRGAGMTAALDGVRVLDLSRLLPGGFCSLLLADFGADVVKVEDTGMGDYVRWAPPAYEGAEPSAASALFLALNRNKRSIRIDLKRPEGRDLLLRLVRDADVVLESFRPGVLDRLGVGYEALRTANPGLVLCSISGYGQDGPLRDRVGPRHELPRARRAARPDRRPRRPAGPGRRADRGPRGRRAHGGVRDPRRAARARPLGRGPGRRRLDGRRRALLAGHGGGGHAGEARRRRSAASLELAGGLVCYRPYACADGWVSLGALEPKFWAAWCRGVGREDLVEGQFDRPGGEVHREVETIFAARTRAEWLAFAGEHDCCLEPVLDLEEALASELVRARDMVVEIAQPGAERPVRLLGVPVKLGRTPGDPARAPGPALGEHTHQVLSEAGLDAGEIEALEAAGVVAGPASDVRGSFLS